MPTINQYFFAIVLIISGIVLFGCEKYALDEQMEKLCSKDGGVKVYETVTLPPEMFDRWGDPFPGWRSRPQEERLGPDYRLIAETVYIKEGDPFKGEGELSRTEYSIYRRSDKKLMGKSIFYIRSGGDFMVFSHPSSNSCPVGEKDLIHSVFLKRGE